jgi:hypothetical protein
MKDANDYAEVTRELEPVLILAREHKVHVLLIHHGGKAERAEATDSILGSTAFFAAVDSALVLKRKPDYRTLQSTQRYGVDLEETVLQFDTTSRTFSLGELKTEHDQQVVAEAILDFLKTADKARTQPEIEDHVEGRTALKRRALADLVSAGTVAREGGGKRGDPFFFSCSHYSAGTRKQETENGAETRVNGESILVPTEEPPEPQAEKSREQESGDLFEGKGKVSL